MASTLTNLIYHCVFSTKHRKPLIDAELRDDLYKYIGGIIRGEGGALLEVGGIADHIHIVARSKPSVSVAQLIRVVKANSSKWANERSRRTARFAWQAGYAAFSISESQIAKVRDYVVNQEQHHRRRSFQEEFVALLLKHGVQYDERYVWD